jgi:hypothetical protein
VSLTPDLDMAHAFIAGLTGSPDTEVLWQLVADSAAAPASRNITHWWALNDKTQSWLSGENSGCGMGVFIQVNEGNSERRRTENVVALRALFIDDDKGVLPPGSPQLAAVPPTLTVRTRKGWHHYWGLVPGEALSAFTPAQATLAAHFGTDPAVKDLPRVMRVPGFFHMKDPANPVLVQLVRAGGERYTIADVLKAYPAPEGFHSPAPSVVAVGLNPSPRHKQGTHRASRSLEECKSLMWRMLKHPLIVWMCEDPDAVPREVWRGVAINFCCAAEGHPELLESARKAFHVVSEEYSRYSVRECDRVFSDALNSSRTHGPMRFTTMVAAGAPEAVCSGGSALIDAAWKMKL